MSKDVDWSDSIMQRAWNTVTTALQGAFANIIDLRDCVEAWKHHCKHMELGTPCAVKTIGMDFFDPRLHCDLCVAEWKRRNPSC